MVSQISRTDGHSQEVSVLQRSQEPEWLWLCQLKAVPDQLRHAELQFGGGSLGGSLSYISIRLWHKLLFPP